MSSARDVLFGSQNLIRDRISRPESGTPSRSTCDCCRRIIYALPLDLRLAIHHLIIKYNPDQVYSRDTYYIDTSDRLPSSLYIL